MTWNSVKETASPSFKSYPEYLLLPVNDSLKPNNCAHKMMRVQFVKAVPTTVVRGEWFSVDLRIVNESNGSVKITSKVAFLFRLRLCSLNSQSISQISASVSLVSHIGAPCEGTSILDATPESPSLFAECV